MIQIQRNNADTQSFDRVQDGPDQERSANRIADDHNNLEQYEVAQRVIMRKKLEKTILWIDKNKEKYSKLKN